LEVVPEVDLEDDDTLEVDVDDLEDCLKLEADVLILLRLEIVDKDSLLGSVWLDEALVDDKYLLDDNLLVLDTLNDDWLDDALLDEVLIDDALVNEDLDDGGLIDEDLDDEALLDDVLLDGDLVELFLLEADLVVIGLLLVLLVALNDVFELDFWVGNEDFVEIVCLMVDDFFLVLDVLLDVLWELKTHLQAFLTAGTLKLGIGESFRSLGVIVSIHSHSFLLPTWLTMSWRMYRMSIYPWTLCWWDSQICLDTPHQQGFEGVLPLRSRLGSLPEYLLALY
jgi:hypothetical protein